MRAARLQLALQHLQPEQWRIFEEFASAFMVVDFPELRTVAGTGDRGRDAELYSPPGEQEILFQYSVTGDWKGKVRDTVSKIKGPKGFPAARELIYVTNQDIGAAGDQLRTDVRRDSQLILDIRDQSWFLDRFRLDRQRLAASEELAVEIVDPLLAEEGITKAVSPTLSSEEAQAAYLYLGLQWTDDSRDKGLTKLCFDALVKTALRGTNSKKKRSRIEVHDRVAAVVQGSDRARVEILVDSALDRLSGRAIRHWKKEDEFCLSQAELDRVKEGLEDAELALRELEDELTWEIARTAEALGAVPPSNAVEIGRCVKAVIENILMSQGEAFALAVSRNEALSAPSDLERHISQVLDQSSVEWEADKLKLPELIRSCVRSVLGEPAERLQAYFRQAADTYTLLAFLRETPDVQSAVKKMFSVGDIWLDTSVILPLFAEQLIDPAQRKYSSMFRIAKELGLALYMTPGVLEEISSHMDRCIACTRRTDWVGPVPFLLEAYTLAGNSPSAFDSWLQEFRGPNRPEEDIAEYLRETHGLVVNRLDEDSDKADIRLRGAVQEVWHEVHERRRGRYPSMTTSKDLVGRLVSHDVENYLGVVVRRRRETDSQFGYRAWWLTLDGSAFEMSRKLKLDGIKIDSPVMSPDFMVNYLTFGPLRRSSSGVDERALPLPTSDFWNTEAIPDLIDEARRIRDEVAGQSDRVVRREVRDRLDAVKRREGKYAKGGAAAMESDFKTSLRRG